MRWLLFLILPAICGCSLDRAERKEAALTCLMAPSAVVGWFLDHQDQADPIPEILDRESKIRPDGSMTHD